MIDCLIILILVVIISSRDDGKIMYRIPLAARSKPWIFGRSLAGIAGSNSAGIMDICLL